MKHLVFTLLACFSACNTHEHKGHSHDEHGHEHHSAHKDTVSLTSYGETTQLFVQYDPLAPGKTIYFVIHLTDLETWRPISQGRVFLTCGEKVSEDASLTQPGIYKLRFSLPNDFSSDTPLHLVLEGDTKDKHLFNTKETQEKGPKTKESPEQKTIPFLLRQQWNVDFLLSPVLERPIHSSFEAFGTFQPKADGNGVVHAPTSGKIFYKEPLLMGSSVERGQSLSWLVPILAEQGDLASLEQQKAQASLTLQEKQTRRKRLEQLVQDGVAPQSKLLEAQIAEKKAQASLRSADLRSRQAQGVIRSREETATAIPLTSPISGKVALVHVFNGQFVETGTPLFQVIDPDPIWLHLDVPETRIPLVSQAKGVSFSIDGLDEPIEVLSPPIAIAGIVDPITRTLPIVFSIPNPSELFKPGMFTNASVISELSTEGIAVPKDAVVYDGAVPVVFVALDGERFEQRSVRLGASDGSYRQILSGLNSGEWVVSKGAYGIRLTALGDNANIGHGHAH